MAAVRGSASRPRQQKPIHALQQRAQLIHGSDIACLAYCGDTSPASQVEIAILVIQSQQATLIELLRNSAQDLMSVIHDTNAIVQKSNQCVNQQSLEISQLATAIHQMTTAIDDVAKNAISTSASAQDASSKAIINQSKVEITQLTDDIGDANRLILKLKMTPTALTILSP